MGSSDPEGFSFRTPDLLPNTEAQQQPSTLEGGEFKSAQRGGSVGGKGVAVGGRLDSRFKMSAES